MLEQQKQEIPYSQQLLANSKEQQESMDRSIVADSMLQFPTKGKVVREYAKTNQKQMQAVIQLVSLTGCLMYLKESPFCEIST